MSGSSNPVAAIRRLPILADSFVGLTGELPWIGRAPDPRLPKLAAGLAVERQVSAILHQGCRDGLTTVLLAQRAKQMGEQGSAVIAADSWVPGPADWARIWPKPYAGIAPGERLRRSFLEMVLRERLTRQVTPVTADAATVAAMTLARGLRFGLIVWSADALTLSDAQAALDLETLAGRLTDDGVLVATLPADRGFDERLEALAGAEGRVVRIGTVLVGSRAALPDTLVGKRPRRAAPTVQRLPAERHALLADEITVPLAGWTASGPAVVRMEEAGPLRPRVLLAEDWSARADVERLLFTDEHPALDLFVSNGGLAGLERRPAPKGQVVNLSVADADGRPLLGAGEEGVLHHDALAARGLLMLDGRDVLLREPAGLERVSGPVFVAASFDNYFHWHNDVLSYLPYVRDLAARLGGGSIRIAAPFALTPWRRRSLELSGLDPDGYLDMSGGRAIRIDGPMIAQVRHSTATPRRAGEAFAAMRAALGVRAEGDRRIWISRSDVRIRSISNEEALRPALERRGFEIHVLGPIDYDAKIRLFASAAIAAGPHGAGFTHSGFMAPGGAIAELFNVERTRRYIPRLAAIYGLGYGWMSVPYEPNPSRSFAADPALLMPALDRLIAAQAVSSGSAGRGEGAGSA